MSITEATLYVTVATPRRHHGRDCAATCLTRAYAFAGALVAILATLHVALNW